MKHKNKVGVVCTTMQEVKDVIQTMYPSDQSPIEDYITNDFLPVVLFDNGSGSWNFYRYKSAVPYKTWNAKYKQVYE